MENITVQEGYKIDYCAMFQLLRRAYCDVFFLEGYEHYRKSELGKKYSKSILHLLLHMRNLAENDLALCLWELYFCNGDMQSGLEKLCNDATSLTGHRYEIKISPHLLVRHQAIREIRSLVLSSPCHERHLNEIEVNAFHELLNELRTHLNRLCLPDIHNEMRQMDDQFVENLSHLTTDAFIACSHPEDSLITHNRSSVKRKSPQEIYEEFKKRKDDW